MHTNPARITDASRPSSSLVELRRLDQGRLSFDNVVVILIRV